MTSLSIPWLITRRAAVLPILALVVGACGQSDGGGQASASVATSQHYSSVVFSVPFTVVVDSLLRSQPTIDSANLLSWRAAGSAAEAVRFLVPVEVYAPGSSSPQPPPSDYLAYLRGQAAHGAEFSSESAITVDRHPGTILTATTQDTLDGSLGCPIGGADRADGCFGLQPDLSLRIAVIEIGDGTTLVAWARTSRAAPDPDFDAMFERMLASLQFE